MHSEREPTAQPWGGNISEHWYWLASTARAEGARLIEWVDAETTDDADESATTTTHGEGDTHPQRKPQPAWSVYRDLLNALRPVWAMLAAFQMDEVQTDCPIYGPASEWMVLPQDIAPIMHRSRDVVWDLFVGATPGSRPQELVRVLSDSHEILRPGAELMELTSQKQTIFDEEERHVVDCLFRQVDGVYRDALALWDASETWD